MARFSKFAIGFAAGVAALFLMTHSCQDTSELKKEAKRLDTVYVSRAKNMAKVRKDTDTSLSGPGSITKDSAKVLVKGERNACDATIAACEAKVANRDAQIRKLQPGRVKLFVEGGYEALPATPLAGEFEARAGVGVNLGKQTWLQVYANNNSQYGVMVRKEIRLF